MDNFLIATAGLSFNETLRLLSEHCRDTKNLDILRGRSAHLWLYAHANGIAAWATLITSGALGKRP